MTRSELNELILPNERNGYRPPVESISLRKRAGGKGIRLILWQSLNDYSSDRTCGAFPRNPADSPAKSIVGTVATSLFLQSCTNHKSLIRVRY
jgi:hypothetical protein